MMRRSCSLTKATDNMANAIAIYSVDSLVKDSEIINSKETTKKFEYKLDEKAKKAKLVKNAKRIPFEIVENSSSSNLIFSPGFWQNVVLPSIRYFIEVKGSKTCNIEDIVVRMADVKTGSDLSGKHIYTQIVFFSNRDKVVLNILKSKTNEMKLNYENNIK